MERACSFSPLRRRGGEGIGIDRTVEEDFVGYRGSRPSPAGADGGARRAKEARGEPERRTRIGSLSFLFGPQI